jgi:uncharacterized protein
MKLPERDAYVRYRMEKAEETYEVALLLTGFKKWNSAINRLYYAAYYAVSGLLVNTGIETRTHSGVKTQFFLHFIKSGKIDLELGKLYADLFDWRQKGDYGDLFDFAESDVTPVLEPVRELIDSIVDILERED